MVTDRFVALSGIRACLFVYFVWMAENVLNIREQATRDAKLLVHVLSIMRYFMLAAPCAVLVYVAWATPAPTERGVSARAGGAVGRVDLR